MNKKIIVIIIISIIFIGTLFIFKNYLNKKTEVPQEKEAKNTSNIPKVNGISEISLTKNGFVPKSITVPPNTKVIWTNNSDSIATVDSNPHPFHTSFTDLNLGEFDKDQKLEFIFTKTGEYSYHNHFNDSIEGKIIVE